MKDAVLPRFRFHEVVESIARERSLEAPARVADTELPVSLALVLDGERFELHHSSGRAEDRIVVECRLGPVAEGQAGRVLSRTLALNRGFGADAGAAFVADEDTNELMYAFCTPLDDLDPLLLADLMTQMAGVARDWRERGLIAPSPAMEEAGA